MSDIFDQFEVGQLPDEISYLFRIAESKGNHPFRNMILSVEPVKSPSTGTLSAFVFASEDEGVEWFQSHPQYNKHKIETTSSDVFFMELEDLKTDRKIEIESLSLWYQDDEGGERIHKTSDRFRVIDFVLNNKPLVIRGIQK